ncbi:unnamed protein product [Peniophora sp. CBMAI 1063]|nr:unnamed protein product [Peniophora sp. CBMAI 1063]
MLPDYQTPYARDHPTWQVIRLDVHRLFNRRRASSYSTPATNPSTMLDNTPTTAATSPIAYIASTPLEESSSPQSCQSESASLTTSEPPVLTITNVSTPALTLLKPNRPQAPTDDPASSVTQLARKAHPKVSRLQHNIKGTRRQSEQFSSGSVSAPAHVLSFPALPSTPTPSAFVSRTHTSSSRPRPEKSSSHALAAKSTTRSAKENISMVEKPGEAISARADSVKAARDRIIASAASGNKGRATRGESNRAELIGLHERSTGLPDLVRRASFGVAGYGIEESQPAPREDARPVPSERRL